MGSGSLLLLICIVVLLVSPIMAAVSIWRRRIQDKVEGLPQSIALIERIVSESDAQGEVAAQAAIHIENASSFSQWSADAFARGNRQSADDFANQALEELRLARELVQGPWEDDDENGKGAEPGDDEKNAQ